MKKAILMVALIAISVSVFAQQTLKDGVKMYNYKRYKTAQQILTPLADKDPQANYYLGLTYLQMGNIAQASATFAKFPEDIANISGTARVAFVSKDPVKGMKIAKDLAAKAKKKDWEPQRYAADAITYTEGGDYTQAAAWYKDALTKTDNADLHIGLGDAMRKQQGGGGEAMTNYEMVTEKDKSNSLAYTRIGDLWYDARNYQSALDNYAHAKDADNSNPLPYKSLANAYTRSGKYKLALQNLETYLEHSDSTEQDMVEYLDALYRAQSFCDAATLAAKMLRQVKDQARKVQIYGILGYSQAECGDSVEALKNLRTYFQIVDQKKILAGDYLQMGKLFMKLGMLDSAGVYYSKGIAGDTAQNKTDVYRTIAEAYKSKKDYYKSAEWYTNLIKSNPETQPGDYAWRVIMYYYCKDLANAMTAANEFEAKYGTTQPSAYYWQGRTAAAIDSEATTGGAVPYFQKWLEKVGPSYDKKNELKGAYEYLMYYYFNKKDKENMKVYKEKILAIDPANKSVKDLEEIEKSAGAPKRSGKK
jgi:tetratricopeptide (TPR) repeat protein